MTLGERIRKAHHKKNYSSPNKERLDEYIGYMKEIDDLIDKISKVDVETVQRNGECRINVVSRVGLMAAEAVINKKTFVDKCGIKLWLTDLYDFLKREEIMIYAVCYGEIFGSDTYICIKPV